MGDDVNAGRFVATPPPEGSRAWRLIDSWHDSIVALGAEDAVGRVAAALNGGDPDAFARIYDSHDER